MAILYAYRQTKPQVPVTDYERDMNLHRGAHCIAAGLWDDTDGFITRCIRMIEADRAPAQEG